MSIKNITCVACPKGCNIRIEYEGDKIIEISGNTCPQGAEYAQNEIIAPSRILPTTVIVEGGILPLVPVKTSKPVPLNIIFNCMEKVGQIRVKAPVKLGDVILKNIFNTGADLVATRDIPSK